MLKVLNFKSKYVGIFIKLPIFSDRAILLSNFVDKQEENKYYNNSLNKEMRWRSIEYFWNVSESRLSAEMPERNIVSSLSWAWYRNIEFGRLFTKFTKYGFTAGPVTKARDLLESCWVAAFAAIWVVPR